jgi:hypothetical protein
LQWYWTLYVIVIGGLLAISSFRRRADFLRTFIISVLYCCFAYKNLGAIEETTVQRSAVLQSIRDRAYDYTMPPMRPPQNDAIERTLVSPSYASIRNFHIFCDVLTILALWTMERRRRREARSIAPISTSSE